MGISAVGARGLRPETVRVLFYALVAWLVFVVYLFGPPLTPRFRTAAESKCVEYAGGNFNTYRLNWEMPEPKSWKFPHWTCRDAREPDKPAKSFGWWVNPF